MCKARRTAQLALVLTLLPLAAVFGGGFDLSWYTIDGGGEMFSTGGDFELSGTIAQHDAGPSAGAMTGGDFELTGGFWVVAATSDPCAAFLCGDANCDAAFDGADIDAFFIALGDPSAWDATYPDCDRVCVADINSDNTVDGADIDAFFAALGDGMCP